VLGHSWNAGYGGQDSILPYLYSLIARLGQSEYNEIPEAYPCQRMLSGIPMQDLLASSFSYLREAQRRDLNLAQRLRAISQMAQATDQLFLTRAPQPASQATETAAAVSLLLQEASQLLQQELAPLLLRQRIYLIPVEQLGEQQRGWLFGYFRKRIYPLLTPLAVDPSHPFPYISSDSLNLLILLQRPKRAGVHTAHTLYARLKVPRQVVPRLIHVPPLAEVDSPVLHRDEDATYWVWSEEVVRYFVHELFAGMSVTGIYQFRVLRAMLPHEGSESTQTEPMRDPTARVVRLDVQRETPPAVLQWLLVRLAAPAHAVFRCATPLGMASWGDVANRLYAG
jgi:polyphosphate kinase